MKDHVEIGHLMKDDAFKVNRDQAMNLKIWFKIHTNVCNFETVSPKTIQSLEVFTISVIVSLKWANKAISSQPLSNSRCMARFYSCHKTDKKI